MVCWVDKKSRQVYLCMNLCTVRTAADASAEVNALLVQLEMTVKLERFRAEAAAILLHVDAMHAGQVRAQVAFLAHHLRAEVTHQFRYVTNAVN